MKRGHEHDVKGHDMEHSEWVLVVERLKLENDRLHNLCNALIERMEKSEGEKND